MQTSSALYCVQGQAENQKYRAPRFQVPTDFFASRSVHNPNTESLEVTSQADVTESLNITNSSHMTESFNIISQTHSYHGVTHIILRTRSHIMESLNVISQTRRHITELFKSTLNHVVTVSKFVSKFAEVCLKLNFVFLFAVTSTVVRYACENATVFVT